MKTDEMGTDRPVAAHGTDRPAPSTTLVHVAAETRGSSEEPMNGSTRSDTHVATPIEAAQSGGSRLLTLGEAARLAGVCAATVKIAIREGRLRAGRVADRRGAAYAIDPVDLAEFRPPRWCGIERSATGRACIACGGPVASKRDGTGFCSDSCRKNWPRRRARAAARAARGWRPLHGPRGELAR